MTAGSGQPPPATIGLAFPGDPLRASTWSGSPAGIASGLAGAGASVRPIRALPPALLDRAATAVLALTRLPRVHAGGPVQRARVARLAATQTPAMAALCSRGAGRSIARAGRLDGVVQIGTGYTLPAGTRIATFEDITIAQALDYPYPGWDCLSARQIRARRDRQRRAYEQAVACCVPTRWAARSIVADYGVPAERVHVVGIGRNHSPAPVPRDWSRPRFLFVGRDWRGKNGPAVLRAFAAVREAHRGARLDIVSDHPALDAPGVHGHGPLSLAVPGERDRLERLFETATCFVLPSRFEAAGIVYNEAAAAGVPSIGTTAGGAGDLIGEGGLVVDPDDADALISAMSRLAEPAAAQRLGRIALERSALYTWPAVGERLLRVLAPPGVPVDDLAAPLPGSPAR